LGEYIFNIKIHCDDHYPDKPPKLRFVDKINMECVDAQGNVSHDKVPILKAWKRDYQIKDVLFQLHEMMVPAAKLKQPPPGSTYT